MALVAGPATASQGRVFRLGGLWWPKSLRSKATHTPVILQATRTTLSASDQAKADRGRNKKDPAPNKEAGSFQY